MLPETLSSGSYDGTVAWWGVGLVLLWLLSSRFEKLKRRYPRFLRYI